MDGDLFCSFYCYIPGVFYFSQGAECGFLKNLSLVAGSDVPKILIPETEQGVSFAWKRVTVNVGAKRTY